MTWMELALAMGFKETKEGYLMLFLDSTGCFVYLDKGKQYTPVSIVKEIDNACHEECQDREIAAEQRAHSDDDY